MIIGQTVFAGSYCSPWFPRQGDGAVFSGECIANSSGSMTLAIQTKNRDEVDKPYSDATYGTIATSLSMTGGTVGTVSASGLKELVRFVYSVAGTGWVHFRVMPPAWRMNGA